ncbi:reverse transcriptase domain-containing protein [Tanacetum coccineum]
MTRQLLDSQGPIPNKTPVQTLEAIQTMADHSQKWHDGSNSRKVSNGSSNGTATFVNKLDSLRSTEILHTFDNHPPFGEKKLNLEELMNKHLEELTRRRAKIEDWMNKLQESTDIYTRSQNASLKNLKTHIEQLKKDYQTKVVKEAPSLCTPVEHKNLGKSAFGVLPCQLPPNELNPGSFTLPCTIGSLNVYAFADLRASVNIMPRSMFNHLKLTNLKETNMLVEITNMMKKAPMGIVVNIMVKIDKFLFPFDFMIIDMLGDPNKIMILGRPFLANIHARINVFNREILLGVGNDRIVFDINGNVHHPTILVEKVCMINEVQEEESFNPLEIGEDLFSYESPLKLLHDWKRISQ